MSLINDALKRASQADKQPSAPRPAGPALQPVVRGPHGGSNSWLLGAGIGVTALLAAWFLWQWFAPPPSERSPSATIAAKPPRGAEKTTAAKPPAAKEPAANPTPTPTALAADAAKSTLASLTSSAKSAATTLTAAVARQTETPAPGSTAKPVEKPAPARTSDANRAAPPAAAREIPPAVMAAVAGPAAQVPTPPILLDPVQPAPLAFPPIRLQGVIYRPTQGSAFINGRMMSVGDQIEEATLVKIDRQSVTFELGKESKIVQLAR